MFIPDVINTLLMGLIFMVVIVTIVRPFVLNMVGQAASNSDMQKAAIAEALARNEPAPKFDAIGLRQRARPFIEMLRRCIATDDEGVWGV